MKYINLRWRLRTVFRVCRPTWAHSKINSAIHLHVKRSAKVWWDTTQITDDISFQPIYWTVASLLQQNRKLELLTIDRVPKPSRVDTKNCIRVIVVLARSHPGESVTSFVCQGMLEFLLGTHPIAMVLRESFVFKIVPIVNPDGVFLGNNRCNLIGQDLNRCWNVATEFSHPTILAIKNLLKDIDSSNVIAN